MYDPMKCPGHQCHIGHYTYYSYYRHYSYYNYYNYYNYYIYYTSLQLLLCLEARHGTGASGHFMGSYMNY